MAITRSRSTNHDSSLQAEWRRNIQDAVDRANSQIDKLASEVSGIKAILDTYAQMAQSMAGDRMSKAMYETAHKALEDRVAKLEGTGGRFIAWAGLGVALLGLLLTMGVDMLIGAVWLFTHH